MAQEALDEGDDDVNPILEAIELLEKSIQSYESHLRILEMKPDSPAKGALKLHMQEGLKGDRANLTTLRGLIGS